MKKLGIGIISMIIFYAFNYFFSVTGGHYIFTGDSFTLGFHLFTYLGLMTLCGVIVVCTYIIIEKLNEIKNESNELIKKDK